MIRRALFVVGACLHIGCSAHPFPFVAVDAEQLDAGEGDAGAVDARPDRWNQAACVQKIWDPRPCATSPSYADHGWPFACGAAGFGGWCCDSPDASCPDDAGVD